METDGVMADRDAAATPVLSADIDAIIAAVRSVVGPSNRPVQLHEPEFVGNERAYVLDCIDTGWVSSVGAYVDRIERDLADYTGAAHAIATANGTAALHISYLLAGVQPGDEVLMPTMTFIATANAASYAGAIPHFVDVERVSLGIDPVALDAYLDSIAEVREGQCFNRTTGRRIGALCVMHAFGHPARLDAVVEVAARWALPLVEDAAESLGSTYRGRHTGNQGVVASLSFNGNKTVTTGGGGAILTNDPALARRAKHLTTTARVPHRWNFVHDEVGYNYRMPNINAALGCAQIERMDSFITRKRELARRYDAAFQAVPSATFAIEPEWGESNYWLNAILLDRPDEAVLVATLEALNVAGIGARPLWTLMHHLAMYRDCPRAPVPVAEALALSLINLPSSPALVGA
jgi:perosamine synthetase